jgi:Leucine-rich repeat (LRR) protein
MQHHLILPLVLAAACLMSPAFALQAIAGPFPDKNLEAAVRALVYDKKDDPSKELTEDDLTKIYLLEAKGKGIRDLTGLEKCVNLQLIDLANNEISDLTPLKGLKTLQSLTLAGNKITDLGPIANITAL